MGKTTIVNFTQDDGTVLEVDCALTFEGYNLAPIVEEYDAWRLDQADDPDAPKVELSEAEFDRLCEQIAADPDTYDYGD